jgi:hypothetical protein
MLAHTVEHGSMRILPEGAKASVLRLLEDREVQGDVAYQLGHTRVAHAEGSGVMKSVVGHTMSMHAQRCHEHHDHNAADVEGDEATFKGNGAAAAAGSSI